jgi:hypothetical protein
VAAVLRMSNNLHRIRTGFSWFSLVPLGDKWESIYQKDDVCFLKMMHPL